MPFMHSRQPSRNSRGLDPSDGYSSSPNSLMPGGGILPQQHVHTVPPYRTIDVTARMPQAIGEGREAPGTGAGLEPPEEGAVQLPQLTIATSVRSRFPRRSGGAPDPTTAPATGAWHGRNYVGQPFEAGSPGPAVETSTPTRVVA